MTAVIASFNTYSRARYMSRMDSSTYLYSSGSLSGAADGKQFTVSAWIASYNGASSRGLMQINSGDLAIYFTRNTNSTAYITIEGKLSGTTKLYGQSTSTISVPKGTTASHIFVAIDLSSISKRLVYFNGSAVTMTWSTYTNSNITQTGAVNIGKTDGSYIESDVYDFWYSNAYYAPATYLSAFYNAGVSPNLGANGQIPTGSAPLVYLNGYNNFSNRGTGGALTVSGSVTQGEAAPI